MNDDVVLHGIDHDASLVQWFLALTPAQRVAELESRIEFVLAARRAVDEQLYPDSRKPRTQRG